MTARTSVSLEAALAKFRADALNVEVDRRIRHHVHQTKHADVGFALDLHGGRTRQTVGSKRCVELRTGHNGTRRRTRVVNYGVCATKNLTAPSTRTTVEGVVFDTIGTSRERVPLENPAQIDRGMRSRARGWNCSCRALATVGSSAMRRWSRCDQRRSIGCSIQSEHPLRWVATSRRTRCSHRLLNSGEWAA